MRSSHKCFCSLCCLREAVNIMMLFFIIIFVSSPLNFYEVFLAIFLPLESFCCCCYKIYLIYLLVEQQAFVTHIKVGLVPEPQALFATYISKSMGIKCIHLYGKYFCTKDLTFQKACSNLQNISMSQVYAIFCSKVLEICHSFLQVILIQGGKIVELLTFQRHFFQNSLVTVMWGGGVRTHMCTYIDITTHTTIFQMLY